MLVRKAELKDLPTLVDFIAAEFMEAEGSTNVPDTLENGIRRALIDNSVALYWVLLNEQNRLVGSVSVLQEWSDWHAGYYWWIQSLYIRPADRGKGYLCLLLNAVKSEMKRQNGLELRLYVDADNQAAIKAYQKANFVHSKYKIMTLRK